jgi:glyoxylase-like metal-dependent hydrolase (beta-lactamase superfamily II)
MPTRIAHQHRHLLQQLSNMYCTSLAFYLQIIGPHADASRIPGIDVQVGDGDTWQFGQLTARVFDTPGHTRGHITYWFPDAKALFPGEYRCIHEQVECFEV